MRVALSLVAIGVIASTSAAFTAVQKQTPDRADPSDLREQGRYLVHNVAMCVQCHSPRDAQGSLKQQQILTGGTIPFERPYPDLPWALSAPRLAGLPGWDEAEIVTLLTTGHRPDADVPRPPMPPFRLDKQDARAVVAYLKSLRT